MDTTATWNTLDLVRLALPVVLLIVTYFIGSYVEKKHYESIHDREARTLQVPTTNFPALPVNWQAVQGDLVTGSVVISVDYFKRFLAALRAIIGGRVKSYETLLDRGRREAILRMKEEAISRGYNAVINVRLMTSAIANNTSKKSNGVAGIEVLAFGTAVKIRDAAAT